MQPQLTDWLYRRHALRNTVFQDENGNTLAWYIYRNPTEEQIQQHFTPHLQVLVWEDCPHTTWEVPAALRGLRWLDVGDNRTLQYLTFAGAMPNLEHLDAHGCNLQALALPECPRLDTLDIARNHALRSLTFTGACPNLRHIEAAHNALEAFELPDSCDALELLYVHNNPYWDTLDAATQSASMPELIREIRRRQKASAAGTMKPILEAKVMFVGDSNVGKTALMDRVRNSIRPDNELKTTLTIEAHDPMPLTHNGKTVQANFWDLGGQSFMRDTHKLFFTEATLYVLVVLAREERKDMNAWLQLIQRLGGNSPVLIVINKIDIDPHDLDRRSICEDYPNVFPTFIRTDKNKEDTIDALRNAIAEILTDAAKMPEVFKEQPPLRHEMRELLRNAKNAGVALMTIPQVIEGLPSLREMDEDDAYVEATDALSSMDRLGITVFRQPKDGNELPILDPNWFVDAVYTLITHPRIKEEQKGAFSLELMRELLKDIKNTAGQKAYSIREKHHETLVSLMKDDRFRICYETEGDAKCYYLPVAFPDKRPDDLPWKEDAVKFKVRYAFGNMPTESLMARLIVKMHKDINGTFRWRTGVLLRRGAVSALVTAVFKENIIEVAFEGEAQQSDLWRDIQSQISEEFKRETNIPDATYQRLVEYEKDVWIDYDDIVFVAQKNISHLPVRALCNAPCKGLVPVEEVLGKYSMVEKHPEDGKGGVIFNQHIHTDKAAIAETITTVNQNK